MNNRFLIGMPGCGKSTVANVFDWKYNEQVYDTDACIVSKHGEISKIFEKYGEEYFREIETEVIKQLNDVEYDCFISVGGGAVLREENVRIMKSDGNKIIYLRTKLSTLEERLKNDTTRPLLKGDIKQRLNKLFAERSAIYEGIADIIVDTDGLTPEQIFENILTELRGIK
ncbi:MAG: shikimate kinase [Clostridia bacterium]|nr:shikimate kinase [Clostridia bacterium]